MTPVGAERRLLVLGYGFSASRFVDLYGTRFSQVTATVRTPEKAAGLAVPGVSFEILRPDAPPENALIEAAMAATHVLVSVPPGEGGDPALQALGGQFAASPNLGWIGYLSTTGVYGDQGGRWTSEETPPQPGSARAQRRLAAEQAWRELERSGLAVQVFRLSGIYGPGRNALVDLRNGEARRLTKPGQVFNRIHIDDIAHVIAAAIERPAAGPVFNVGDDEPASQADVVAFAAGLLAVDAPPLTRVEDAVLSEMARSFWAENKRMSNARLKQELGLSLQYPTYREGLTAIHEANQDG